MIANKRVFVYTMNYGFTTQVVYITLKFYLVLPILNAELNFNYKLPLWLNSTHVIEIDQSMEIDWFKGVIQSTLTQLDFSCACD